MLIVISFLCTGVDVDGVGDGEVKGKPRKKKKTLHKNQNDIFTCLQHVKLKMCQKRLMN